MAVLGVVLGVVLGLVLWLAIADLAALPTCQLLARWPAGPP